MLKKIEKKMKIFSMRKEVRWKEFVVHRRRLVDLDEARSGLKPLILDSFLVKLCSDKVGQVLLQLTSWLVVEWLHY